MAEKKAKRAVLLRKGGKDTAVSSEGLAGKARKAAEEGKTSFRGGFLGLGKKYNIVPGKTSSSKSSPSARVSSKKSTTRPKARPATLSGVSFGGAKATDANAPSMNTGPSTRGGKRRAKADATSESTTTSRASSGGPTRYDSSKSEFQKRMESKRRAQAPDVAERGRSRAKAAEWKDRGYTEPVTTKKKRPGGSKARGQ